MFSPVFRHQGSQIFIDAYLLASSILQKLLSRFLQYLVDRRHIGEERNC